MTILNAGAICAFARQCHCERPNSLPPGEAEGARSNLRSYLPSPKIGGGDGGGGERETATCGRTQYTSEHTVCGVRGDEIAV